MRTLPLLLALALTPLLPAASAYEECTPPSERLQACYDLYLSLVEDFSVCVGVSGVVAEPTFQVGGACVLFYNYNVCPPGYRFESALYSARGAGRCIPLPPPPVAPQVLLP